MKVLYEDAQLIAVNKNWSDVVQADRAGSPTLLEQVQSSIGAPFLGLVHRLDRPTSGVVLFARSPRALARLSELFRTRKVCKIYWTVVSRLPSRPEGKLEHYLSRSQELNKSFAGEQERPGARKAELAYRHLLSSERYHLLEIRMQTGRHHQIRAQLAAIGCPIKGDLKYGARRSNPNGGIHLHARSLSFLHPLHGRRVTIVAAPPPDPLWDYFSQALEEGRDPLA